MPSLNLDNRLIWFAHCPKAGGTSVEQMLVDCFGDAVGHLSWGWDLWWKNGGWRQADPPNSPQHLIWKDAQGILPKPPDAVFALVRDPMARMVSEYHYQRDRRRGTRAGRWLACLPFSLWLRLMLRLARLNPYAFDNHLRPQCDFVPKEAEVFPLEDGLGPVGDWLGQTIGVEGLPARFPHALPGKAGPSRVDPRDQALIALAFAADYSRFKYDLPPPLSPRRPLVDAVGLVLVWPVRLLERCGRL